MITGLINDHFYAPRDGRLLSTSRLRRDSRYAALFLRQGVPVFCLVCKLCLELNYESFTMKPVVGTLSIFPNVRKSLERDRCGRAIRWRISTLRSGSWGEAGERDVAKHMLGFRNGGCTIGQGRTRVEWLEYHPEQSCVKTPLATVLRRWPEKRQVLGYSADHDLNPPI